MTRSELIRKIERAARQFNIKTTYGERKKHTKLTVGKTVVWIPRHHVVNSVTMLEILQDLENEFGKGWYRK